MEARISNLRTILAELEAKQGLKGQTTLVHLEHDPAYQAIEKFLLQDRHFTTYMDFESWAKKVRPTIVCECAFTSTGDRYSYEQIRNTAKQCLTKPEVEVV